MKSNFNVMSVFFFPVNLEERNVYTIEHILINVCVLMCFAALCYGVYILNIKYPPAGVDFMGVSEIIASMVD